MEILNIIILLASVCYSHTCEYGIYVGILELYCMADNILRGKKPVIS